MLGTGVATRRIQSGQSVQVDGDAGKVTLLDGRDEPDPARPSCEQPLKLAGFLSAKTLAFFALTAGAVVAADRWRKQRRS